MSVLNLLKNLKTPVDVPTLVEKLGVNKTTVYRQIEKLLESGQILEIELGDGKKRYEIKDDKHHHHLVCRNCGSLEDIHLSEDVLLAEVNNQSKFKVEHHSLEFFGLCVNCI
jgi:Fur family ferric uptake transcriptional regulator